MSYACGRKLLILIIKLPLPRGSRAMFDRFNICVAYYVYALEWHGGQDSKAYKIFGRLEKIGFKTQTNRFEQLSDAEKIIYEGLVNSKY